MNVQQLEEGKQMKKKVITAHEKLTFIDDLICDMINEEANQDDIDILKAIREDVYNYIFKDVSL